MTRARVWLVRHAAPAIPAGITVGAGDPPLSEAGCAQAQVLAASLANMPLTAVWSSDRTRAVETAKLIAAPHELAILTTPALRELDFGVWEGRDLRELWLEDPRAAQAWEADITDTPGSFAESVHGLMARVRAFWVGLELTGDVAVVAHRGSLSALQSVITGRPFAECFRYPAAWVEAPAMDRRPAGDSRLA